ncbi:protein kinase domain-containing protein [Acaryochloris marina NIES-2412]|uniref:protein kinase domain-containing protein n=1 Tax=Acaryochloris marina TaxID=155978 RepID=UPI0040599503
MARTIYCINPGCKERENPNDADSCQSCGTSLLVENDTQHESDRAYRLLLVGPLKKLDPMQYSEVFEVLDLEEGEIRILKVLKDTRPKMVELFKRESLILRTLNHPGIPKVWEEDSFTVILADNATVLHCLCMPKFAGENLSQWLAHHKYITQTQALDWLTQLVEILHTVHKAGVFHRDIKPSNIMLQPNGKLALIDFGGARPITDTYLAKVSTAPNVAGVHKSTDVTQIVSYGYTPLEQFNGKALPQSDFYALGRSLIHLATGRELFELPIDEQTGNTLWRQEAPQIAKPLADFIDELCAIAPTDRPKNTQEILNRLQKLPKQIKRYRRFRSLPFKIGAILLTVLSIAAALQVSRVWLSQSFFRMAGESEGEGNLEAAQTHYERAIWLDSGYGAAYNNLAIICQRLKKYPCAIANFNKVLELKPNNTVVLYNLGVIHDDAQDYEEARRYYKKSIEAGQGDFLAPNNNLARLDILKNDNRKAAQDLAKILGQSIDPQINAVMYKNLGWAQFNLDQYEKAAINLKKSIELDPNEASSHCLLAQTKNKQNQTARSEWELCLFLNSEVPEVWKWKQEFIDRLEDKP